MSNLLEDLDTRLMVELPGDSTVGVSIAVETVETLGRENGVGVSGEVGDSVDFFFKLSDHVDGLRRRLNELDRDTGV